MENPQRENGHIDIANEIAEALMRTNLSGYQSRILWAIWRKTYGWQKKEDWIARSQFVEMTGMRQGHICRTLKELSLRNIVTQMGNKIAFNKYYSQWRELPKGVRVHEKLPIQDKAYPNRTKVTHSGGYKRNSTKDTIQIKEMILSQIKDLLTSFPSDIQILLEDFFTLLAAENKTGILTAGRKLNVLNEVFNVYVANSDKFKEALEITIKQQAPNPNYIKAVLKGFKKKQGVLLMNKDEADKKAHAEAREKSRREVQKTKEMLDKIAS